MMRTISKTKEPTLRSLLHLTKVSRFYAANFTSFKVDFYTGDLTGVCVRRDGAVLVVLKLTDAFVEVQVLDKL